MLVNLEPLICDLNEKLQELDYKKEKLEKVSRFIAYINNDVHLVGIYADQELIYDNLENIDSNKAEYKACCYLLENDNENIKKLPQYIEANNYILNLINYFKKCKNDLTSDIQELEKCCHNKKIEKKYYDMFSENKVFVKDTQEFEKFLDEHEIEINDKIQLLKHAINSNIKKYQEERGKIQ